MRIVIVLILRSSAFKEHHVCGVQWCEHHVCGVQWCEHHIAMADFGGERFGGRGGFAEFEVGDAFGARGGFSEFDCDADGEDASRCALADTAAAAHREPAAPDGEVLPYRSQDFFASLPSIMHLVNHWRSCPATHKPDLTKVEQDIVDYLLHPEFSRPATTAEAEASKFGLRHTNLREYYTSIAYAICKGYQLAWKSAFDTWMLDLGRHGSSTGVCTWETEAFDGTTFVVRCVESAALSGEGVVVADGSGLDKASLHDLLDIAMLPASRFLPWT